MQIDLKHFSVCRNESSIHWIIEYGTVALSRQTKIPFDPFELVTICDLLFWQWIQNWKATHQPTGFFQTEKKVKEKKWEKFEIEFRRNTSITRNRYWYSLMRRTVHVSSVFVNFIVD